MNIEKKEDKNQKHILGLIIVILIINTLSILGVYLILNDRITDLNVFVIKNLRPEKNKGILAEPVSLPSSEYAISGSEGAPVSLILISDMECPYCKEFNNKIMPEIISGYADSGLVKIGFLSFPLESIHPKALPAAVLLYEADFQGKFREQYFNMADRIDSLSADEIADKCDDYEAGAEEVREIKKKLEKAGIKGTPSVVINGKLLTGFSGLADLSAYIDNELKKSSHEVSIEYSLNLIEKTSPVIIDVRTADEFAAGHIEGALNIDVLNREMFIENIDEFSPDDEYLVYCKSGKRSTIAYYTMMSSGLSDVYNMSEGWAGWTSRTP